MDTTQPDSLSSSVNPEQANAGAAAAMPAAVVTPPVGKKSRRKLWILVLIVLGLLAVVAIIGGLVIGRLLNSSATGTATPTPSASSTPMPSDLPTSAVASLYYQINCRFFEYNGSSFSDITASLTGYTPLSSNCPSGARAEERYVFVEQGLEEGGQIKFLDLKDKVVRNITPMAEDSNRGIVRAYNPANNKIYAYNWNTGNIYTSNVTGGDVVALVYDFNRVVQGREGIATDELSLVFNATGTRLLINDTISSAETGVTYGTMILNLSANTYVGLQGTHGAWLSDDEIAYNNQASVSSDSGAALDRKIYKFNVESRAQSLLWNRAFTTNRLKVRAGKLLIANQTSATPANLDTYELDLATGNEKLLREDFDDVEYSGTAALGFVVRYCEVEMDDAEYSSIGAAGAVLCPMFGGGQYSAELLQLNADNSSRSVHSFAPEYR